MNPAGVEVVCDSPDQQRKLIDTRKAEAARVGALMYELSGGAFLVMLPGGGGWARELPDLHAVDELLRRLRVGC